MRRNRNAPGNTGRAVTKHTVTAVNYLGGERRHETTHRVSTLKGLRRIAAPAGDGWGKRLVMTERAARQFGAYKKMWVVSYAGFIAFIDIIEVTR